MTQVPHDLRERLRSYGLTDADLALVRRVGEPLAPRIPEMVTAFYVWLRPQPVFARLLANPQVHARVEAAQRVYWVELVEARLDGAYLAKRLAVGEAHARIDLPLESYMSAVAFPLDWLLARVAEATSLAPDERTAAARALAKLVHFDTSLIVQAYADRMSAIIAEQGRVLVEMSTPAILVAKDIALVPLVGAIDAQRATQLVEHMLELIARTASRVAILDVTGVPVIDTHVASHLLKALAAARMLGAKVIVTGISPDAAQSLVRIGADLSALRTEGTLAAGVEAALALVGRRVVSTARATHCAAPELDA